MNDRKKTKDQLINELVELRKRIAEFEKSEAERKQTEDALLESKKTARVLLNTLADVAALVDTGGIIIDANEAMAQRFSRHVDELIGIHGWDLLPPDMVERRKHYFDKAVQSGRPVRFEDQRQGTWFDNVFYPVLDAQGNVTKVAILARDITERRRAEETLKESENTYRNLADNALVGIYKTSMKGDILYVNEAMLKMLEFGSPEEMISVSTLTTYKNPDDRNVLIEKLKKTGRISNFETELLTKTGKSKYVILNATLEDDVISGMMMDITERKRAEEMLHKSEEKYRELFEEAMDAIFIADVKSGTLIDCNRAASELVGREKSELISKHQKILHPPWKIEGEFSETFKEHLKEKEGQVLSTQIITKDGEIKEVEIKANLIELRGKTVLQGIFRDVTERKRAEETLRESEERYRTIFEDSREAIYVTTKDGKFIEVNEAILDLFGYTREEMLKLKAKKLYVNPDARKKFQKEIEQTGSVRNYEIRFRKKDGTEIDCLITSTVRKAIDGTIVGYQGIIRDITELKKIEDQLRHLSLHDPLTGLYNRAYFEEEMHRIESSRYDSVGIIMCDVDGLKLVNDALGHYNGDKLLLATANVLRESFREGDVIARVGGDEFAVLLPASDINAIEIASNRIQDAVARYNSSNLALPLSISMGFALSTEKPIIMSNLFKEADNNMYREKLHHSLTARSTIVQNLMKALETRDFVTEGHVNRLQKLVVALAKAIGLPENSATDLCHLAEFHDIGKVGIPDHILFKQGDLTPDEVIEMQRHCEIGHRIAMCTPDLVPIADLILKHHEWWNGKGYPLGLKEEQIPLECRILAICETYEAMTSDRPYHKAISRDDAIAEVKRCSGTKFDPDLVSRFIQVLERP